MEVYVDDMLIKTQTEDTLLSDMAQVFDTIRKHNMRLNPAKCTFAVEAGKFLGFMITQRGIEANPDKCRAILDMKSLTCVKEVQQLNGRLAVLSRFLAGSAIRSLPFYATLRKGKKTSSGQRNTSKPSETSKNSWDDHLSYLDHEKENHSYYISQ